MKGLVIKTKVYRKSLFKLRDQKIISIIEKKIDELKRNPKAAEPMSKQHSGICEIRIGKYRVYCIRKDNNIIKFLLGPVFHHKGNYQKTKEYRKLFLQLEILKMKYLNLFNKIENSFRNCVSSILEIIHSRHKPLYYFLV